MKREAEKNVLVSSLQVTELLKKLIEDCEKTLLTGNVLNISDYSTKLKFIK